MSLGHRPVIVKKGSDWLKRWVEAQHNILSCRVFHDVVNNKTIDKSKAFKRDHIYNIDMLL